MTQNVSSSFATSPSIKNLAFKGDKNFSEERIVEAIEDNSSAAKNCSKVALATSVATLLPLSVLAIKTGKISKVADDLQNGVKPIIDNVQSATGSIKNVITNFERQADEISKIFKSEEWNKSLSEIRTKISEMDAEKLIQGIEKAIQDLTEVTTKKINEIDPNKVNELIGVIEKQIDSLNIQGLSDDARNILNEVAQKISTIKFSVG